MNFYREERAMNTNKQLRVAGWIFCISAFFIPVSFLPAPLLAQTPVRSSREARLKRIEEHRQVRQRTMELTRDLRRLQLTPEQKSEIRKVLTRYNTAGAQRHEEAHTEQSETQGCGTGPTHSSAADRMNAEVLQILTSEQSEKLNSARQEREERAQRGPDFQVRKKP